MSDRAGEAPTWQRLENGTTVGVLHPDCNYLATGIKDQTGEERVWFCNKCGAGGSTKEVAG